MFKLKIVHKGKFFERVMKMTSIKKVCPTTNSITIGLRPRFPSIIISLSLELFIIGPWYIGLSGLQSVSKGFLIVEATFPDDFTLHSIKSVTSWMSGG